MQVSDEELHEGLLDLQLGDEALVNGAVRESKEADRPLSSVLSSRGVPANQAVDAICAIYGLPRAPPELLRKASSDLFDPVWDLEIFWRLRAVPFFRRGRHLWFAFCDAHHATEDTSFGLPAHRAFLTHEHLVLDALHRLLGPRGSLDPSLMRDGKDGGEWSTQSIPQFPLYDSRAPTKKMVLDPDESDVPATVEESTARPRRPGTDFSRLPATLEDADDERDDFG